MKYPTVDSVEAALGISHEAWDTIDPNSIIKAVIEEQQKLNLQAARDELTVGIGNGKLRIVPLSLLASVAGLIRNLRADSRILQIVRDYIGRTDFTEMPHLRSSFRTTAIKGCSEGVPTAYMKFGFRNEATLNQADDEWRAFCVELLHQTHLNDDRLAVSTDTVLNNESPEEEGKRLAASSEFGLSDLWGACSRVNFPNFNRVLSAFCEARGYSKGKEQ